jgi:hypothetical protein
MLTDLIKSRLFYAVYLSKTKEHAPALGGLYDLFPVARGQLRLFKPFHLNWVLDLFNEKLFYVRCLLSDPREFRDSGTLFCF